VLDFAREGEPLRLVLLLDVSGSMRTHLAGLARAATAALAPLRPGDEVAIMLFSNGTKLVQPFTSELSTIGRQIVGNVFQSQLGQETYINEAIVDAASSVQKAPGRHAILIVTDNQTLRSRTTDDQASRALQDANAVLDAILIGDGSPVMLNTRYGAADRRMPDVRVYTSATGGEAVSEGDVAAVFQRLVNQIRTRYYLQYAMPAGEPGAHRSIRVTLAPEAQAKNPGAIVHAREGYYVPR
jgi:VWFA-related protein